VSGVRGQCRQAITTVLFHGAGSAMRYGCGVHMLSFAQTNHVLLFILCAHERQTHPTEE